MSRRVTPAPLDPIISLSVAIAERPGSYAFLLGSGVSRDAGVPTGGEVLHLALGDLYRLEHPDEQDPAADKVEAWASKTGHDTLSYSDVLERLGPDAPSRQSYLAKYFEGREPSDTHRLLARLAAQGLIRVFITTNFDRLLEDALKEVGITPTVITAEDDLIRATEREHATCYLLKVHGDYLQQTIRNTASELAELDPKIAAELQEITDRYGLVVVGYSGSDAAVAACLRQRNASRSTYWVSRGEPGQTAANLIEGLDARVIRRDTAAQFLTDLDRRIDAFRAHPTGETPEAVRADVVRLLRQRDEVGLREKLRAEWRGLEARVHDAVEPRKHLQSVENETAREVNAELAPAFERMLAALLPLIDHDTDLFAEQLQAMRRIIDRAEEVHGDWEVLPQWAVWVFAQTCGAYAVCRERFPVVAQLLAARVEARRMGRTLATFVPCRVGQLVAVGAHEPPLPTDTGGEWIYLADQLNGSTFLTETYPELFEPPRQSIRWLNDFNFLASYAAARENAQVVGYWRMDYQGGEPVARRLARDPAFADGVARSCFGQSGDGLRATVRLTMVKAVSDIEGGALIHVPGGRFGNSDAIEALPEPPAATAS